MTYSDTDLERIKQTVPLWQVAEGRVPKLKKVGKEWVGCCPFHDDNNAGSFKIYQKNGQWVWTCHAACGKTGNIFQFLMATDGLSFDQAVQKLDSTLTARTLGKREVERTFQKVTESAVELTTIPVHQMDKALEALEKSTEAQKWLESRGISLDTARKFKVGFLQNASTISKSHRLVDKGWLIFPTIEGDKITSLKYRSIADKDFLRLPNMVTTLFGLENIEPFEDCFLCEGEMDAVALGQGGFIAASLPSASYTPTPEERDKLRQANCLYLAGDSDEPGQKIMNKLWSEFQDRTYKIEWPSGVKDANEFLIKCGSTETFRSEVEKLKSKSRENPVPNFFDLSESIRNADFTNPMDDPTRLHFPWRSVDRMAVSRRGSVVSSYATWTGSGKTTWWMTVALHEAMVHKSVVLNYSGELSPQELSELTTAILTHHNRMELNAEHYKRAADKLTGSRFYVGYNPDLNIKQILGDESAPGVIEWGIRRLGAQIVILDHLHFFTSGSKEATSLEAWAMTRIKNLARKYNLIFIVIGQSRKTPVGRNQGPSDASAAKGSEAFLSTANTTYHIHREMKKDINFQDSTTWPRDLLANETEIRLYKSRTKGPGKAVARLFFEGETGTFWERDMIHEEPV